MSSKHQEIVDSEPQLAEHYLSPFSGSRDEDQDEGGRDPYLDEMNSLFRLQSVLSSCLNLRPGTFDRETILITVDSIIKSAGRFACTNIYISSQFFADPQQGIEELRKEISSIPGADGEELAIDDSEIRKLAEQFVTFFSWWSVVASQGVLGRFLSAPNTVRALQHLHQTEELDEKGVPVPEKQFNFLSALGVAKLWQEGRVDTDFFDRKMAQYGDHTALADVYRFAFFVYSRYMPVDYAERQWLNDKLRIPLKGIRYRQRNMLPSKNKKD